MTPTSGSDSKTRTKGYYGDPLNMPVQYLKGIGPARARDLAKQGISTVRDLIERVPRAYRDYSHFKRIAEAQNGQLESLMGTVVMVQDQRVRGNLNLTRVIISDGSGTAAGVWFNQPWQAKRFPIGTRVLFAGPVERRGAQVQIVNPEWEIIDEESASDPLHAGRIVPVYPLTGSLNPRDIRRAVHFALQTAAHLMPDTIPPAVRERQGLMPMAEAWRAIHFPDSEAQKERARTTLAFEELLVLQTGLHLVRRQTVVEQVGIAHGPEGEVTRRLRESLPFRLTAAQERVIRQVAADMESPRPMNRLIQGDVGSGKTMVAVFALAKAVDSGHQGALMAPTEILAEQHYLNLRRIFAPLGVQVVLVTGSLTKKERDANLGLLQMGAAQIAVGTHALIEDRVNFRDLSLVITDEQHRFGVRQRARLQQKGEVVPDVLVMTATPIPRTLALTLYGDLDVSVIDELPPGRRPVGTYWRPEAARRQVYNHLMRTEVPAGRQGYVVCPLVAESDKLQAQAATEWYERLRAEYPEVRMGLLHGRLPPAEKEAVMEAFRRGEIQVLVATTVIEVGVDVPNATMMIIEGADRFGLAQLHQLRGRVGRGSHQSYCVLIADPKTPEARERLQIMQKYSDGFALAEKDLELRGPGEFFGTRQHGMPDLKVANPIQDLAILERARAEAARIVAEDPQLHKPEHQALRQAVKERLGEEFGFILVS
ncbi:MAG: ATP-dependent DNA helicase RecG [Symbiobacterium sp.]|uniref:ATP-dependent DNA helicase RecG n=1 Tax=Symbiobacterium sp. TaxID=1971213 RepID=UPI0034641CD4